VTPAARTPRQQAGTPAIGSQQQLASPLTRLGAKLIDSAVWGVPFIFYIVAVGVESGALATVAALALLAIPIVQAVLLVKDGQTMGKKALNIRVVMFETGWPASFRSTRSSTCSSYSGTTIGAYTT
jgi:hypothetical protein